MNRYHIISADGHVIEPPDLWQRHLPSRFHERMPRLVKDPMGGDAWELVRGAPAMPLGPGSPIVDACRVSELRP